MAINTTLESVSTTAASNGPAGSDQRTLADDGLRQYVAFTKMLKVSASLASASTVTPPSTANVFNVTGTTTINTIASTNSWDGRDIIFIFAGALTLTNSSNLACIGAANITTAANDAAWWVQTGSGAWRMVGYSRADGSWLVGTQSSLTLTGNLSVQGNSTLGNAGTDTVTTNGNVVLNAPSSGYALSSGGGVALTSNGTGIDFTNSGAGVSQINYYGSTFFEFVGRNAAMGWKLYVGNGTLSTTWGSAGNVTVAAPSSAETLTLNQVSGGTALLASSSLSGSVVAITATNTSNTASSDMRYFAGVAGTSAGDPYFRFNVLGTQDWSIGIDNSDSDSFKFSASSALGTTDRLALTTDGRLYGTALHNNAGAVTGTTNQYVCSGTYTPTLTNGANVAASTAYASQWMRVGNVVTVSGKVDIDPTLSALACTLGISLPIASNIAAEENCCGTAKDFTSSAMAGSIRGDSANDRATLFTDIQATANNESWFYQFTYVVL